MPQIIDVPGQGQIEFPDSMDDAAISAAIRNMSSRDRQDGAPPPLPQTPPTQAQKIEPPNWFERQLAKLPLMPSGLESNLRGFVLGAADPSVGAAQLAANLVGQGQPINRAIQAKEQEYQQQRASVGREGVDLSRLAGNIAFSSALPLSKVGAAKSGAILGAINPVTEGDYAEEKLRQTALGAAGGKAGELIAKGASRVLSPMNAAIVRKLRGEGIEPTVGQALGGAFNKIEEKATSLPLVGEMIGGARQRAQDQFNKATLNKALSPIGEKVDEIGQAGIKQAGDKLSNAFDKAIGQVQGVKLDSKFNNELGNLRQLASGLDPNFQSKFEALIQDKLLGKAAPNGGMIGENFQKVYSDLGQEASRFAGQQSFGARDYSNAVKQLQTLLQDTAERTSNPQAQTALKAAREGWAKLIRIEKAGAAAKGTEGVFTPGQLLNAVKASDTSVRDRATARGTALLQDWATAGQNVLGNKVPDSGTAGRLGWGLAGLSGAANPVGTAAALGGGALAYTPQAQKALVSLAMDRPEIAQKLAQLLRNNPNAFVLPAAAGAQALNQ